MENNNWFKELFINEAKASLQKGSGGSGSDGFSPTIDITDITGGHRITITDVEGEHIFDVMDGEKGDTGGDIVTSVLVDNNGVALDLNIPMGLCGAVLIDGKTYQGDNPSPQSCQPIHGNGENGKITINTIGYEMNKMSYALDTPIFTGDTINHLGVLTRVKKKVVLDGVTNGLRFDLDFSEGAITAYGVNFSNMSFSSGYDYVANLQCSHAPTFSRNDLETYGKTGVMGEGVSTSSGGQFRIYFSENDTSELDLSTITKANAWLASEYAKGTPVTIVYSLNNPETEQLVRTGQPLLGPGYAVFLSDEYCPDVHFIYSHKGYDFFGWIYQLASVNEKLSDFEKRIYNLEYPGFNIPVNPDETPDNE